MYKISCGMSSICLGDKSPTQMDGIVKDNLADEKISMQINFLESQILQFFFHIKGKFMANFLRIYDEWILGNIRKSLFSLMTLRS